LETRKIMWRINEIKCWFFVKQHWQMLSQTNQKEGAN
jgi:hypothetical protein